MGGPKKPGKDARRTYKGIDVNAREWRGRVSPSKGGGGKGGEEVGKGPLGAGSGNLGDTTELAETIAGTV